MDTLRYCILWSILYFEVMDTLKYWNLYCIRYFEVLDTLKDGILWRIWYFEVFDTLKFLILWSIGYFEVVYTRGRVELNRTNFELSFNEFFELFFTFSNRWNLKFSKRMNEFRMNLKNFTTPDSWSRIESNKFQINLFK